MNKKLASKFITATLTSSLALGVLSAPAFSKYNAKPTAKPKISAKVAVKNSAKVTPKVSTIQSLKVREGRINLGQFSLNAKIMGTGKVSVVFESGYGDGLYTYDDNNHRVPVWDKVQSAIAKNATTIAYDRAGLGASDNTANRDQLSEADEKALSDGQFDSVKYDSNLFNKGTGKTSLDKAKNLHALLKAAKITAPYLLVVHSISSLEAVEFTKLYPKEVSGIVMVDGSGVNVESDMDKWIDKYNPGLKSLFLGQFTWADGTIDEELQSELQVNHAGDVLRNVPLTVLSAKDEGMGPEYQAIVNKEQDYWQNASNKSKRIFVPNTGHYIHLAQPQYVINAIDDMIKTITSKKAN